MPDVNPAQGLNQQFRVLDERAAALSRLCHTWAIRQRVAETLCRAASYLSLACATLAPVALQWMDDPRWAPLAAFCVSVAGLFNTTKRLFRFADRARELLCLAADIEQLRSGRAIQWTTMISAMDGIATEAQMEGFLGTYTVEMQVLERREALEWGRLSPEDKPAQPDMYPTGKHPPEDG